MSFLNFVLENSGCSKSLTVTAIVMIMERLMKVYFEKISDTTMLTCNLPAPPIPQHVPT